jgi:hypothetical protein
VALILLLTCGCELVDRAARKPGDTEDFAQRKVAHLTVSKLADFDSVSQPRPRIDDVVSRLGEADAVTERELSRFGVSARARVYEFGTLGLATPVARTDGEIFWTLIAADPE